MKRIVSSLFVSFALVAGTAAVATAQPAPPAAASAAAAAEVKAGTGVENKESVGTATEFAAGTKVWIWSRITGAANTTVQHVWKKDGAKVWAANLKIKGNKWTTSSRRQLKAGSYSVEVVGADGTVLGSTSFTVK
jgi:cytochrome b subunit of formate dehydrogenase